MLGVGTWCVLYVQGIWYSPAILRRPVISIQYNYFRNTCLPKERCSPVISRGCVLSTKYK